MAFDQEGELNSHWLRVGKVGLPPLFRLDPESTPPGFLYKLLKSPDDLFFDLRFSVAALLPRAAGAELLFDLLGYQSGPFGS